jgi:hypothetical protein
MFHFISANIKCETSAMGLKVGVRASEVEEDRKVIEAAGFEVSNCPPPTYHLTLKFLPFRLLYRRRTCIQQELTCSH